MPPRKRYSYLRWTPERIETLKRLRNEKKSLLEIASIFGVRKCAVTTILKRFDLDRETQYWQGVETREKVLEQISIRPIKNKDLRELLGISPTHLHRIVSELICVGEIQRCKHGHYTITPRKRKDK